jgi:hypothetical protein
MRNIVFAVILQIAVGVSSSGDHHKMGDEESQVAPLHIFGVQDIGPFGLTATCNGCPVHGLELRITSNLVAHNFDLALAIYETILLTIVTSTELSRFKQSIALPVLKPIHSLEQSIPTFFGTLAALVLTNTSMDG